MAEIIKGCIVEIKGIQSPRMLVTDVQIDQDDASESYARAIWFSVEDIIQSEDFPLEILELADAEEINDE